jgi:hypothetical protein
MMNNRKGNGLYKMNCTFHGQPDPNRIADALSIILSQKYNADVIVRVKGGEKDGWRNGAVCKESERVPTEAT